MRKYFSDILARALFLLKRKTKMTLEKIKLHDIL